MESTSWIKCTRVALTALAWMTPLTMAPLFLAQGCAVDAGAGEPKPVEDGAVDDAIIAAGESGADTVNRPTLVGGLEQGDTGSESFGPTSRYLAWHFDLQAGDEVQLIASGAEGSDVDTVLALYHATSTGRPRGSRLAFNDDRAEDDLRSEIHFSIAESGRYVGVVRRYDRGASGRASLSFSYSRTTARRCGGLAGQLCPEGSMCIPPAGACNVADVQGTCSPLGSFCTAEVIPVCGCNGITYNNTCEATRAGVGVEHDGPCAPGPGRCGGITGQRCEEGSFCVLPDGMCNVVDAQGTCSPVGAFCTEELDPVCGCDNVTYDNRCFAIRAGVGVARDGSCIQHW